MRLALLAAAVAMVCAARPAAGAAPLPGFRPPAVPLLTQSPLINVWSRADALNGAMPSHWTGAGQDLVAMARVDGAACLLMGQPGGRAPRHGAHRGRCGAASQARHPRPSGGGAGEQRR